MRKGGAKFKRPYAVRLALVRRYLETDVSADELAIEAGVQISTFRRWVRELRPELEEGSLNGAVPYGVEETDPSQGRLPIAQTS